MKQTAKRITSLILSVLMLVSLMSVFTFAANSNFEFDDEYYDRAYLDSVVVNPQWADAQEGDELTYVYRDKTITETYDPSIHFASIQEAYDFAIENGQNSPTIVVAASTVTEDLVIKTSVTILGANAGINPNVVNEEDPTAPWETNIERGTESILKGIIDVNKNVDTEIQTIIDGVLMHTGFAYVDAGTKPAKSTIILRNTVINGAGAASYGTSSTTSVCYFGNSANKINSVELKNVRAMNMKASSIVGPYVANLDIDGLFYTASSASAVSNAEAYTDQHPDYVIRNSMFYNNNCTDGVISFNHSTMDSSGRAMTELEVFDCVFMDGPNTSIDDVSLMTSPIQYTIVSTKNIVNVHDCIFKGNGEYVGAPINLAYTSTAFTAPLMNNIKFNSNKLYGYTYVPDTAGLLDTARFDFTGNYYADSNGEQANPNFPSAVSYRNINMDYYWIDEDMTVSSDIFHIESTGITGAEIDHKAKTIEAILDYGDVINVDIVTFDPSTEYKLVDENGTEIKVINTEKLISGYEKNKYFAVGTSDKAPGYEFVYEVTISTYDPELSRPFDIENTYMLDPSVKELANGTSLYKTWDGMLYEFVVGETIFASAATIINVCDTVPTIVIPAGVYSENIILTGSAILLGAKHGINPNLPQYTDPNKYWKTNPERADADQETIFQNATVSISIKAVNASVMLDGFTFGKKSGFLDRGEGLETYTTTTLKNIIVDGAGDASWKEENKSESLTAVFSFGGSNDTFINNHKDIRLVNVRMVDQGTYPMIGDYYESLLMDGVCYSNNSQGLYKNDWTAPKGQNFYLEMRNCDFVDNKPGEKQFFLVNNNMNDSPERTSNRIVLEHNIFHCTSEYKYGIFGIRFTGAKDSLYIVDNIFVSATANALFPGNTNWFLGKSGIDKEVPDNEVEIISDVFIRFNRFCGCTMTCDLATTKDGTLWDYSYNYFNPTKGFATGAGSTITDHADSKGKYKCDYYYSDYAMTTLTPTSDPAANNKAFASELSYSINGSGVLNESAKTYTDTVAASTGTYDFGIKMTSKQASYGIYSDKACTVKVPEPVALKGGTNVLYIKFSSFDGTKNIVYTATINKPAATGADITRFGNFKVTDDAIYACVPTGTTEFLFPEYTVSTGATAAIYNDFACTSEYTLNYIGNIGVTPTVKFIKVQSQDGKTTKIYSLTILQAENDQGALIYINGAEKISANGFEANIPANASSFAIDAICSEGATMQVYDNGMYVVPSKLGVVTIDNIPVSKTVDIVVTSKNNVKSNYTLNIVKDKFSCDVAYIFNMVNNGDDETTFEAKVNTGSFEVLPTLENTNATYKVYSDRACTKVCDNDTVQLTAANTTAYLKVTSADGTVSKIFTLNIKTTTIAEEKPSDPEGGEGGEGGEGDGEELPEGTATEDLINGYTIENGTRVENTFSVSAADNLSTYSLKFKLIDPTISPSTYRAYADAACTIGLGSGKAITEATDIPVSSKTTTFYVKVWGKKADGTGIGTDIIKVVVNSNRAKVTYKDASSIAGWAIEQVNYLNDNGYGYFVGDNGNFNPKNDITRFEVAAIAVRVLGINAENYANSILPFKDNIPAWAANYVKTCYTLGIMNGKSSTEFCGKDPTTRQEFAKIIVGTIVYARGDAKNAEELYASKQEAVDKAYTALGFADDAKVSGWAKPYVRLAVSHYGLMNGSSENGKLYVNPTKPITRQEVAVLLANYCGYKAK